ncbi:DUF302 domain-containing protein [Chitinispirillales bacterium ANBcel5]|uniref:DUF302 domain-containing protein n=1 Tax=Cellulosispirillum alkaliphilum TaxID=3039283 RepID=UPI002A525A49|nr:DUF302 domain-containing protein [Chitinispirillales bacterium ANBcel5]
MISYGISKNYSLPIQTVLKQLPKELTKKGFSVLSTYDIEETFNEHLGVSFKPYYIISAAILPLAYKALLKEEHFGVVLPCNVAVFKKSDQTVVTGINPNTFMHVINNENLNEGALVVERKLREVLIALEKRENKLKREKNSYKATKQLDKVVA